MNKKINCIMLVDDNKHDNFFHERTIKHMDSTVAVIKKQSGREAIEYLRDAMLNKNMLPDLLLLDINMPVMNGWEFLEEYKTLDKELLNKMVIVILTTSDNPDDKAKAKTFPLVSDFKTKPLTERMLVEIIEKKDMHAKL